MKNNNSNLGALEKSNARVIFIILLIVICLIKIVDI